MSVLGKRSRMCSQGYNNGWETKSIRSITMEDNSCYYKVDATGLEHGHERNVGVTIVMLVVKSWWSRTSAGLRQRQTRSFGTQTSRSYKALVSPDGPRIRPTMMDATRKLAIAAPTDCFRPAAAPNCAKSQQVPSLSAKSGSGVT